MLVERTNRWMDECIQCIEPNLEMPLNSLFLSKREGRQKKKREKKVIEKQMEERLIAIERETNKRKKRKERNKVKVPNI